MARDEKRRSSGGGSKKKKMTKTLVVGPFRMAFPHLFEPEETDNGDRYKVTALFPPDYDLGPIEDAMDAVMEDAFGDKEDWPTGRNDVQPEDKLYKAGTKDYAGFKKGWWAMSISSSDQPGIVDADKEEVMSKREVYGGRWARAQISITTYDNKSKGVGVYLNHVQLLDHDEQFNGKGSAEDAFDKYALKDKKRKRDDDDDEDEKPARKRGRDRDDDEDEKPVRRSRSRDDDNDEKPVRRSRSRDDDEDEEKPRAKKRPRDDDEDEKPARRRSRDDDDEEEKPRARRSASRDDDDSDDRPSRRGAKPSGSTGKRSSRNEDDWD